MSLSWICNDVFSRSNVLVVPPDSHYLPAKPHELLQVGHLVTSVLLLEITGGAQVVVEWRGERWRVIVSLCKRRTYVPWWFHRYRQEQPFLLPDLQWCCSSVMTYWTCKRASFSQAFNIRGSRHTDMKRVGPSAKMSTPNWMYVDWESLPLHTYVHVLFATIPPFIS